MTDVAPKRQAGQPRTCPKGFHAAHLVAADAGTALFTRCTAVEP